MFNPVNAVTNGIGQTLGTTAARLSGLKGSAPYAQRMSEAFKKSLKEDKDTGCRLGELVYKGHFGILALHMLNKGFGEFDIVHLSKSYGVYEAKCGGLIFRLHKGQIFEKAAA